MIKRFFLALSLLLPVFTVPNTYAISVGKQACLNAGFNEKECGISSDEDFYKNLIDKAIQFKSIIGSMTPEELYNYTYQKTDRQLNELYNDKATMSIMYYHFKTGERRKIIFIVKAMKERSCSNIESKACRNFLDAIKYSRLTEEYH